MPAAVPASPPELTAPMRAWLDRLAVQQRASPLTVSHYRRDLLALLRLGAGRDPATYSPHDIRRFAARLHSGGLSGRSIARTLSAWRGFYAWWGREGGVEVNPVEGVRAPKSPKPLPAVLSPEQTGALLDAPRADEDEMTLRDQAMFELFYSSGLRLSELASLDVGFALDLREGEVTVLGKRAKIRTVPVGKQACEALAAWMALRAGLARSDEAALFISAQGRRLSTRTIQRRLAACAQAVGLGVHVHPHMLRHSFASHVLQSSGDLRAVQELLGHASISTTQIYTHLDFQHLAKAYDAAHPRARKK